MHDRIKQVIDYLKISERKFAQSIEIPESTLYNSRKRNSDLSSSIICTIAKNYPNLNTKWLLTGVGEMWLEENTGDVVLYKRMLEEHKSLLNHAHLIIDVWQKKYEDVKEELEELQTEIESLRKQLKEQKKQKKETK